MKASRKVMLAGIGLGLAGAALGGALIFHNGAGNVMAAVAAARWGLLAVIVFHAVPLLFDVWGWQVLFPVEHRLRTWTLMWMRWMGESFSALLPVAQLGGDLLRVRLAAAHGGYVNGKLRRTPLSTAIASVLGGITTSLITQLIFFLTGVLLLFTLTGRGNLFAAVLIGSAAGLLAVLGFYWVQHVGIFRVLGGFAARMARSGAWADLAESGSLIDQEVRRMYTRHRSVLLSCLYTMGNWLTGAAETWIALHAVGIHCGYGEAYVLESVSQAIRSAAFLVPGALGLQEGGYLVIGAMFGIPSDTALALSLIKRARELVWGIPGLLTWQWLEGRRWMTRRLEAQDQPPSGPEFSEAPGASARVGAK